VRYCLVGPSSRCGPPVVLHLSMVAPPLQGKNPQSCRPCAASRRVRSPPEKPLMPRPDRSPRCLHLLLHRLPRTCLGLSNHGRCALRACSRRSMPCLRCGYAAQHHDARGQPLSTKCPRASLLAAAYRACAFLAPSHPVVWAACTAATWRGPSAACPPLQGIAATSPRTHAQ
jgi:hypothetical protein